MPLWEFTRLLKSRATHCQLYLGLTGPWDGNFSQGGCLRPLSLRRTSSYMQDRYVLAFLIFLMVLMGALLLLVEIYRS